MKKESILWTIVILLGVASIGSFLFVKFYRYVPYTQAGTYDNESNAQEEQEEKADSYDLAEEDQIIEIPHPPDIVKDTQQHNESEDATSPAKTKPVKKASEGRPPSQNKKVFLTFDDGPTSLTPKVLDILKEYEVHATFFTIGRLMEKYPEYVLQAYNEGNMILPHSYSHDFAIYTTFDTFYEDFYRAEETYKEVLGFEPPPIFRFPGGSSNHSSFEYGGKEFMPKLTEDIKQKGYYYIDWNIDSGDTGLDKNNADKLLKNVLRGIDNHDLAVILFHDLARNKELLEILPEIIETLIDQGYTFRTFRDITEEELNIMVEERLANRTIIR